MKVLGVFIFILCSFCSEILSQRVTYHTFQNDGKIGIVDNLGNVTLEPKFDNREYFIRGFNTLTQSKYLLIYNNEIHKSSVIDYKGKEYFKDINHLYYTGNGEFCVYYDDHSTNMGLHVLSLTSEREVMYFKERASIDFHGTSEYFFSCVHNGAWKIYNNQGENIYKLGAVREIDVLEKNGRFLALAISDFRGTQVEYIDKNGNPIIDIKSENLRNKFLESQKVRNSEEDVMYDYPTKCLIDSSLFKQLKIENLDCFKYNSGNTRFIFTKEGKKGVMDEQKNILIQPEYDKIEPMSKYFKVYIDDKIGLYDHNGMIIYNPIFSSIRYEPSIENFIDVGYKSYVFSATFDGQIFAPKEVLFE